MAHRQEHLNLCRRPEQVHFPDHHHQADHRLVRIYCIDIISSFQITFTNIFIIKLSFVQQEVRFKVHDPKAYSKGGTLENTINGARGPPPPPGNPPDEEAPGPPIIIPASKVWKIVSL